MNQNIVEHISRASGGTAAEPTATPSMNIKEIMSLLGFQVEAKYNQLVCYNCHSIVDFAHSRGHLETHRQEISKRSGLAFKLPDKATFERIVLLSNNQTIPSPIPTGPITEIEGLRTVAGYRCPVDECGRLAGQESSYWKHDCTKTPRQRPKEVRCYLSSGKQYTEVSTLGGTTIGSSVALLVAKGRELGVGIRANVFRSQTDAHMGARIMTESKWGELLVGNESLQMIRELAIAVGEDEKKKLELLRNHTRRYYNSACEVISSMHPLVLRLLITRDIK